MDAKRFDQLAKSVSATGTRRGLARVLAMLPLTAWLAVLSGEPESVAKRRKDRDKGRDNDRDKPGKKHRGKVGADNHKHEHRRRKHNLHRRNGKNKKKKCKPESSAQTCEGKCGTVKNTCQKMVDCGSCACEPACLACTICDAESGQCQPDPAQDTASCGGCRVCDNGQCVTDETIVCTAIDQCHDAGECDPATGACTNPRKADGAPCDDDDPCTTNDSCQNGECRGTPKDCSAEADVCNDGICRADTTCGKRPKPNGTGCNADNDSCTAGDSCQDGVCTAGAGVDCRGEDDECNRGVCRQSDGACIKDPRDDGTPCGANGECVNGSCEEVVCLALGEACEASDNQCCGDAACTTSNCFESGGHCCHGLQGACDADCACCGEGICSDDACCHHTQGNCESTADCCQNFFNRQECIAGRCCALPDEPCEAEGDCCEGLCDPEDSVCTGCFTLQRLCEDESQCCQSGGATHCQAACDFDNATCCRPPGGNCSETCDCCDQTTCCNGVCCEVGEECDNGTCRPICRGHGQNCIDAHDSCCSGFECRSANFETVCRPVICWEFSEFCGAGDRPCCTGECTWEFLAGGFLCCSPEGEQCDNLGVFFPGQQCCGTNVCNGANRCARCRQLGETCDGGEQSVSANCCNSLDSTEPPLRCVGGTCVR